jgi:hypothetical protein
MFSFIRTLTAHVAFALWIFGLVPANAETSGAIHFLGSPQDYRDPQRPLPRPPGGLEIPGKLWAIYGEGIIDRGATARLRDFLMTNNVPHRSQLILNSDGGSLSEAMRLGEFIRKYGLITEIGTKGNGSYDRKPGGCYSACTLAFLGGKYRFISPGSTYGVHRFYSRSNDLDADDAQIVSGSVVKYIRDMGVDPALFTLMTEAGPAEIIRVEPDLLIQLNIVNNGVGPTAWSIETLPSMDGMYLKGVRDTWRGTTKFIIYCNSRTPTPGTLMVFFNGEGWGRKIVNTFTAHVLFIDDNVIPITALLTEKPDLNPNTDEVFAMYSLTEDLLKNIAVAKAVGVGILPSANSRMFMGFISMPFADGARKLPGFLRACRQE